MKPAPRRMMYRKDLVQWLGEHGYTERQVRRFIEQGVIRRYRWSELLGSTLKSLPGWSVFLESQVRDALESVLTNNDESI